MPPERHRHLVVASCDGLSFDVGLRRCSVKIDVHSEDVASVHVGAANRAQYDISLVRSLRPIHEVVLTVNTQITLRSLHDLRESRFLFAREGKCLALKKFNFVVDGLNADVLHLGKTRQHRLVHQASQNWHVLSRLALTKGRAVRNGECFFAATAAISLRAAARQPV